jgi:muconolactone delta-isomerase
MAAVEFIEKMDALSLKIDGEAYEALMQESISEFNQHHESSSTSSSSSTSFNAKMDLAEAKAEEFFLKAKEAFKATGEKANQAISTFKESSLAKKSMERIQAFMKDMGTESESVDEADEVEKAKAKEREYEEHLSRAISMSLSKEVAEEEVDALALVNNTDEFDSTTDELPLYSTTDATTTTTTINTDNDPTTATTTTNTTTNTTTTTTT